MCFNASAAHAFDAGEAGGAGRHLEEEKADGQEHGQVRARASCGAASPDASAAVGKLRAIKVPVHYMRSCV